MKRVIVAVSFVGAVILLFAGPALAQDEEARPWKNVADLSFVLTGGNSSVTTLSVSDKFTYKWARSEISFEGTALRTRTRDRQLSNSGGSIAVTETSRTTAEEYAAEGRYRYRIRRGLFAFTSAGWDRNELAGIENRYTGALGLGYRIIDREETALSGNLGGDFTQENSVSGDERSFVGAQAEIDFSRQLTSNAVLDSNVQLLENLEDTEDLRVNLSTAVTTSVSRTFAIKLSYLLRFDNQPVRQLETSPGVPDAFFVFDEIDTRFAASLVVNF